MVPLRICMGLDRAITLTSREHWYSKGRHISLHLGSPRPLPVGGLPYELGNLAFSFRDCKSYSLSLRKPIIAALAREFAVFLRQLRVRVKARPAKNAFEPTEPTVTFQLAHQSIHHNVENEIPPP